MRPLRAALALSWFDWLTMTTRENQFVILSLSKDDAGQEEKWN
jgi:hypothetical protein